MEYRSVDLVNILHPLDQRYTALPTLHDVLSHPHNDSSGPEAPCYGLLQQLQDETGQSYTLHRSVIHVTQVSHRHYTGVITRYTPMYMYTVYYFSPPSQLHKHRHVDNTHHGYSLPIHIVGRSQDYSATQYLLGSTGWRIMSLV